MDDVCSELQPIRLGMIWLYMPDIDNIDTWYKKSPELSEWGVSKVTDY